LQSEILVARFFNGLIDNGGKMDRFKRKIKAMNLGTSFNARTKNIFFFVFASVLASLAFIQAGFSSEKGQNFPGIYKVDYKLVFLLHPMMAEFDLTLGRFLRNDVNLKDGNVLNKLGAQMAEANALAQKNLAEIQKQIDQAILDLQKIEREKNITFEVATGANASEALLFKKKKEEAEKKIADLRQKQADIQDGVFDPMYISRKKTVEKVNEILKQIDSVLQKFSQEKNGALIVDSNFVRNPNRYTTYHPSPEACFSFLSIGLRQDLLEFNSSMAEEMRAKYNEPEMQKVFAQTMGKDYQKKLEDAMNQASYFHTAFATTLTKYPGIGAVLGNRGRLFLAGGENIDITKEILEEIYKMNNVKEDVAKRILQLVPVE